MVFRVLHELLTRFVRHLLNALHKFHGVSYRMFLSMSVYCWNVLRFFIGCSSKIDTGMHIASLTPSDVLRSSLRESIPEIFMENPSPVFGHLGASFGCPPPLPPPLPRTSLRCLPSPGRAAAVQCVRYRRGTPEPVDTRSADGQTGQVGICEPVEMGRRGTTRDDRTGLGLGGTGWFKIG